MFPSINRRQKSHKTFVGKILRRRRRSVEREREKMSTDWVCIVLFLMFAEPIIAENCEGEEIGKHGCVWKDDSRIVRRKRTRIVIKHKTHKLCPFFEKFDVLRNSFKTFLLRYRQWSYLFLINIKFNSFSYTKKTFFSLSWANITFMIVKNETFTVDNLFFLPFNFHGRMLKRLQAQFTPPTRLFIFFSWNALNSQKNERCQHTRR